MSQQEPAIAVDTARLQELSQRWDDRSRRSSAAGWVHHIGEVLFVLSDRWKRQPQVVPYLVALAVRDAGLIVAGSRGIAKGQIWKWVTITTDLAAAARISKKIPTHDFANDHAISQWGLSLAWVMAADNSEAGIVTLIAYPVLFQVAAAKIWKLPWRDVPWYVAKEGFWSAATLWAVDDLRHQILEAVAQGRISAQRQAEILQEEKRAATRAHTNELVWRWIHRDGISALGTIAFEAEARSSLPDVSAERSLQLSRLAHLAKREANTLRIHAPIDEQSLAARLGRMLAFRDLYERGYYWDSQALPPRVRIQADFLDDLAKVEAAIVAVPDEITIGIHTASDAVTLWASGQFDETPLPSSFTLSGSGPIKRLRGRIPCET